MSTEQRVDGLAPADGGPAFPRIDGMEQGDYGRTHIHVTGGLTVRDYFAGRALQGFLSDSNNSESTKGDEKHWTEAVARLAYQIADAMLKARARSEVPHE